MDGKDTDRNQRLGLTIVYTGGGKGKTTAALGLVLRAWGQGFHPCVIQFMKSSTGVWGETRAARQLGIEWHQVGDGFTWLSTDIDQSIDICHKGWQLAQERIRSPQVDLVVLDEFTYPLSYGWLDAGEVIAWLRSNRPPHQHLVITGRDAPDALCAYADLVTEMKAVKHPFELGIKAQRGIEF